MKERIHALAAALGRDPGPALDALARYCALVKEWNARTDLTAARDDAQLVELCCADALVLADRALVPEGARVVDVGSGAGMPGFPLALLRPDLGVTLVEPLRKRVAFLRTAIGTLDVAARVKALEQRVDPKRPSAPGMPFDVAVARATFAPTEWLPMGRLLARSVLVLTAQEPSPEGHVARVTYQAESGAPRAIARYDGPRPVT